MSFEQYQKLVMRKKNQPEENKKKLTPEEK
jgi:hypothetical protein